VNTRFVIRVSTDDAVGLAGDLNWSGILAIIVIVPRCLVSGFMVPRHPPSMNAVMRSKSATTILVAERIAILHTSWKPKVD